MLFNISNALPGCILDGTMGEKAKSSELDYRFTLLTMKNNPYTFLLSTCVKPKNVTHPEKYSNEHFKLLKVVEIYRHFSVLE